MHTAPMQRYGIDAFAVCFSSSLIAVDNILQAYCIGRANNSLFVLYKTLFAVWQYLGDFIV